MTLTHNGGPVWADPAINYDGTWVTELKANGLSAFGEEVVKEMNRIGMMVDISHVHEACMNRVLDVTRAPVIFSHSSSKALCAHPRDVPDDVVVRTMQNGGIIMINFCAKFIAGPFWCRGGMAGATLLEVADHIDHVKKVCNGSCAHIGIGADYDGIVDVSRGLEDVSMVPRLTAELIHRGYTDEEIGGILGLNLIRVLATCEQVSREMKAEGMIACDATLGDIEPQHAKPKRTLE
jgi:membrane dipeptidase